MILYDNANQNIETADLITFAKFYTKYITTKKKCGLGWAINRLWFNLANTANKCFDFPT